jgi:hypothetical protein
MPLDLEDMAQALCEITHSHKGSLLATKKRGASLRISTTERGTFIYLHFAECTP